MGVTMAGEGVMSSLKMGDHSSTFGGGPVACSAACATLDVIRDEGLPERARELGERLMEGLRALGERYKIVREVRGTGLMVGLELRFDVLNVIMGALDRGVLVLDAGRNVVRLLPPLVIDGEQVDRVVSVLDEVLGEEEAARVRR
jgi:acetylornithine/LysW-gamma-L-lysine aminotransferase